MCYCIFCFLSFSVCKSIDIRSKVSQFEKLRNCTVIEGHLRISLIGTRENVNYDHLSFPELVEITDYLMLYRVNGLKSLSKLFPNLAVLRGHSPFHNYALIIYELQDLIEIGLPSLQVIHNGGVRLTRNPLLCFIQTIDWNRLNVSKSGLDFMDNKEESSCANYCPERCNTSHNGFSDVRRCWNQNLCQKNLSKYSWRWYPPFELKSFRFTFSWHWFIDSTFKDIITSRCSVACPR